MTADEFYKTALVSDDGRIIDVRPFGKRQAESVDFYLQDIATRVKEQSLSLSRDQSVLVRCDHGTCFHYSTMDYYRQLWTAGFPIRIEEKRGD